MAEWIARKESRNLYGIEKNTTVLVIGEIGLNALKLKEVSDLQRKLKQACSLKSAIIYLSE